MTGRRRIAVVCLGTLLCAGAATWHDVHPLSSLPAVDEAEIVKYQFTDRDGIPLLRTFQNRWNVYEQVPLHEIPEFLVRAFVASEDHRFYDHHGVDWVARLFSAWQNIRHLKAVRGASTISEQVIRLVRPRPRTLWTRWVEGFESMSLEQHETKDTLLEFYLNQVPYAGNRRGVAQAARYYFGRDLMTLSRHEQLALAVIVRNPSAFDPKKAAKRLQRAVRDLAARLVTQGSLTREEATAVEAEPLSLESASLAVEMPHFTAFIAKQGANFPASSQHRVRLRTTIQASLQTQVQKLLDRQVERLSARNIRHGGALVVDHRTGEILAWAVAGNGLAHADASAIDTVLTPRQPGSTLKPFLYALALEQGWTAATIIRDAPVADDVGEGLHTFRNFSRSYYGPVTLRQALGNSLNTPAVRTIEHFSPRAYLDTLHNLGFASLTASSDHYGEGLALGDGEVTLFELVQAYTTLANRGVKRDLRYFLDDNAPAPPSGRVFTEETTSIIASILSDPKARGLEFGTGGILELPVQTAVKTGTSTDFRDAWAVGFNYGYVVAIWMGNLDRTPARDVTGALGPGIVLRSIFAELTRHETTAPLYASPALESHDVCTRGDQTIPATGDCESFSEVFAPGTAPAPGTPASREFRIVQPSPHLRLALNPRAPLNAQAFEFKAEGLGPGASLRWAVNGKTLAVTKAPRYVWPLARGRHELVVSLVRPDGKTRELAPIPFVVK